MMKANDKMISYFESHKNRLPLDNKLKNILINGIVECGEFCVFKSFLGSKNDEVFSNKKSIFERYGDTSGYENYFNRIHIDDYVNSNVFSVAFSFLDDFIHKWKNSYHHLNLVVVLSFQNDEEYGDMATFSFYRKRDGEVVYDFSTIAEFDQAILLQELCCPVHMSK